MKKVVTAIKKGIEILYDKLGSERYKPVKDLYLFEGHRLHHHTSAHMSWFPKSQQIHYDTVLERYCLKPAPNVLEYLPSELEERIKKLLEANGESK